MKDAKQGSATSHHFCWPAKACTHQLLYQDIAADMAMRK